jgi:hypothetical protein
MDAMWGIMFLTWSLMWQSYIAGNYYASTTALRIDALAMGAIFMATGACFLVYFMEKRILPSRYRPFTVSFLILIAALILCAFFAPNYVQTISVLPWIPFCIIGFTYWLRIKQFFQLGNKFYFSLLGGFLGMILGFSMTTDFFLRMTGTFLTRLIGDVIVLVCLIIIGNFFSNLPLWDEVEWFQEVQVIYLFYIPSSIPFFEQHLQSSPAGNDQQGTGESLDQSLIIAALSGIKDLLDAMTEGTASEPVKMFRQEDAVVMLEYGNKVAAVAVCKKPLRSVRNLLKRLLFRVEEDFSDQFEHWTGNIDAFESVGDVFQAIFYHKLKFSFPV